MAAVGVVNKIRSLSPQLLVWNITAIRSLFCRQLIASFFQHYSSRHPMKLHHKKLKKLFFKHCCTSCTTSCLNK